MLPKIGLLADTPSTQQIFNGTFNIPPGTDEYAAKLINQLKKTSTNVAPPTTVITAKENSTSWKKQRPATTSEPSTLGFPHYIVGAQDQEVSELDAIIRTVPYETGIVPECFLPITDYPLKKNAESTEVENTRLIQLFDASFNMNNKKLGRDTMQHAEKAGTLASSQYGSRKGKSAARVVTSKVLNYDIVRQKRRAAVHVGLDATQCYDRSAHPIAALCLMKHGAPPSAVRSTYGTLQSATHKVITQHGLSSISYGGAQRAAKNLLPVQGQGQGSGHAPTTWVCKSTEMIGVMETEGHGVSLCCF